jgi:hypothetical protein
MEQNLNERERYIRLGIGLVLAAATIYSSFRAENIYFTLGLGLAALGFIANYFTCFCGTKKMISKLKS